MYIPLKKRQTFFTKNSYLVGDGDTNVCRFYEYKCFSSARKQFTEQLAKKHCDCLPDCTSIKYDIEFSQFQSRYSKNIEYVG